MTQAYQPDDLSVWVAGVKCEGYSTGDVLVLERSEEWKGDNVMLSEAMNKYLKGDWAGYPSNTGLPFSADTPEDSPLLPTISKDLG